MLVLIPAVLAGQYVDARHLFEVMQDDSDTAKVHAHFSEADRRAADEITLEIGRGAAKQYVHKPSDKTYVRAALKKLRLMIDAKMFGASDEALLKEDIATVELGLDGKVNLDSPPRVAGSVD